MRTKNQEREKKKEKEDGDQGNPKTMPKAKVEGLVASEHVIIKCSTALELPSWNLARADIPIRAILVVLNLLGLDGYLRGGDQKWAPSKTTQGAHTKERER